VSDTKQRRVRLREGRWPGLCRGLAVLLRLSALTATGVAVCCVALARGLESRARVLLETVAQEEISGGHTR
jgi:hypothetical protein